MTTVIWGARFRCHTADSTEMARRTSTILLAMWLASASAAAQAPVEAHPAAPAVAISGSLRTRIESWDWFPAGATHDYAFSGSLLRFGIKRAAKKLDWQIELAAPLLAGLPDGATAPGSQGQLGLGASYFAASDGRNDASVFLKQGFVRLKAGRSQSVTIGRMEFADGAEVVPRDATLAAIKRDRIAHRLLGTFAFSHVGRSFDGVQYVLVRPAWNLTVLAARPTEGVFQVNGWRELGVNVYYAALTRQMAGASHAGEWRVFGLGYSDYRGGGVKTDNRPLAARRADTKRIDLFTFGGHYIGAVSTKAGPIDVLLWGAGQVGAWGTLSQRSGAVAAEAGWQPAVLRRLRPWIRGGYDYGSGDGRANDGTHGTFFQVLPTPRVYARFPFFNMMNTGDGFVELVLRPSARVAVRTDVHVLRLADAADLWYAGGGAFQAGTFGYAGRPSNGRTALARLYDASADVALTPRVSLGAYIGLAAGRGVVDAIYPAGSNAGFGYLELSLRF